MRETTFREAINEALREEMRRDGSVLVMGEDVGYSGGVRLVTKGLFEEFGCERVRDTPLAEPGFVGAAVGAALTGMRPVVEVMYSDFFATCFDEIFDLAAKWRYTHGGQMKVPLTVRCCYGSFGSGGSMHSQAQYDTIFMHCPGLRVIVPSTPYDAKGLMKTAIRSNNASIFFEHRLLYPIRGVVPEEEYTIPLGVADIKREGNDVTVVATGIMVQKSMEAAEQVHKEGVSVEVIDPRTLSPLDRQTIVRSVRKTGKLVTVEEGTKTAGTGAEIASIVVEEAFDHLDAPIKRVAARDVPIPYSPPLEAFVIPDRDSIIKAIKEVVA